MITWMKLNCTILSEKTTLCMIPYKWNSGKGKTLGIEDRSMVARDKVGYKSWLKQAWGKFEVDEILL